MNMPLDPLAVATYLADHTHFFEEHRELLADLKLPSAVGGRAVSLQDRQMEVLRDKIKSLELRMASLMRIGHENDAIVEKFELWTRALLMARNDVDLPHTLVSGLRDIFGVPAATLRMWSVADDFSHTWFAAPVSEDSQLFANGLGAPYCGINNDFEAASWLEDAKSVQSVALLPLRLEGAGSAFGLLVLGSDDPARFSADMATDFLVKIGSTASAALASLLE
jgi:uncharacterized protein YigA (DUF484 family)